MATTVASNPVEMPVSGASSPAVLDQWGPSGQLVQPVQMGSQYGDEAIGDHGSRSASRVTQSQDAERTVADGCSSSAGSAPRSGDPRGRNPLIVFDWDDTMLTSSWIQSRELLQAASYEDLPIDAQRDLAHLERSVVKCLTHARTQGTVIIITNAESGWVELSAAKFFANLLPLLEGVPVVSARSLFEAQFPGSPLCWKSAAFAYMMHDHFLEYPRWAPKMILSVGDSNEEKVAMRIASGQHTSMTSKAVKFVAGPDPEALAAQLDIVTAHLEWILSREGDAELVLSPAMINGTDALPMLSCRTHGGQAEPGAGAAPVTDDDGAPRAQRGMQRASEPSSGVSLAEQAPQRGLDLPRATAEGDQQQMAAGGGSSGRGSASASAIGGRPSSPVSIPGRRQAVLGFRSGDEGRRSAGRAGSKPGGANGASPWAASRYKDGGSGGDEEEGEGGEGLPLPPNGSSRCESNRRCNSRQCGGCGSRGGRQVSGMAAACAMASARDERGSPGASSRGEVPGGLGRDDGVGGVSQGDSTATGSRLPRSAAGSKSSALR